MAEKMFKIQKKFVFLATPHKQGFRKKSSKIICQRRCLFLDSTLTETIRKSQILITTARNIWNTPIQVYRMKSSGIPRSRGKFEQVYTNLDKFGQLRPMFKTQFHRIHSLIVQSRQLPSCRTLDSV